MREVKFKFYRKIGETSFGKPIYKNLDTGKIIIGEPSKGKRNEMKLH